MPTAITDLLPLSTVKAHLRLGSGTTEDSLVTLYLEGAARLLERLTSRALASRTFTTTYTAWTERLSLPYVPAASVTSITYRDEEGASQTLSSDSYTLRHAGAIDRRGTVLLDFDITPPDLETNSGEATITVTYVAGYTAAADLPAELKVALLHLVGQMYEQRLPSADVEHFVVPFSLQAIIDAARIPSL